MLHQPLNISRGSPDHEENQGSNTLLVYPTRATTLLGRILVSVMTAKECCTTMSHWNAGVSSSGDSGVMPVRPRRNPRPPERQLLRRPYRRRRDLRPESDDDLAFQSLRDQETVDLRLGIVCLLEPYHVHKLGVGPSIQVEEPWVGQPSYITTSARRSNSAPRIVNNPVSGPAPPVDLPGQRITSAAVARRHVAPTAAPFSLPAPPDRPGLRSRDLGSPWTRPGGQPRPP